LPYQTADNTPGTRKVALNNASMNALVCERQLTYGSRIV
jgi:hypothetical protein